jgi:hypothetical protein
MVWASVGYYFLVFACGIAGLASFNWGTQLPIIYVEQIIFAPLIVVLLFWEHAKIEGYM